MKFGKGDSIEVLGNKVGDPGRHGVVLEIVDAEEDPPELRVQWDDGHESLYRPAAGMARVVDVEKD